MDSSSRCCRSRSRLLIPLSAASRPAPIDPILPPSQRLDKVTVEKRDIFLQRIAAMLALPGRGHFTSDMTYRFADYEDRKEKRRL